MYRGGVARLVPGSLVGPAPFSDGSPGSCPLLVAVTDEASPYSIVGFLGAPCLFLGRVGPGDLVALLVDGPGPCLAHARYLVQL